MHGQSPSPSQRTSPPLTDTSHRSSLRECFVDYRRYLLVDRAKAYCCLTPLDSKVSR
jgi:hypothetical protein